MEGSDQQPVEIFFSYARQDERLMKELEKHLRIMQRQGLIQGWYANKIDPGQEWEREMELHLNRARIILLLISSDFMDSDHCYNIHLQRALERHEKREAVVIPVILRAVDWEDAPFSKLKSLPDNKRPVTRWRNRDDAFTEIAQGIRATLKTITSTFLPKPKPSLLQKTTNPFFCANCRAPVSLAMPCWKCGLPSMQMCSVCFEKNPLDQETCRTCHAPLALVCHHCHTKNSFEADVCQVCGFLLQLVCDECGENNPPDRETCKGCDVALIQVCHHCQEKNALDAEWCLRCGMPLVHICLICDALNQIEDEMCWRCSEPLDVPYVMAVPHHVATFFPR